MRIFRYLAVIAAVTLFAASVYAKDSGKDKVAAVVEGEEIYMSEVESVLSNIMKRRGMPQGKMDMSSPQMQQVKKSVTENLVNRELLMLASEDSRPENIDEMIDKEINKLKSNFNSDKEFEDALAKNNMDKGKLKDQISKNIVLDSYVKDLQSGINITKSDKKDFYKNNKDRFKQKEQVKVSHIILLTGDKGKFENPEKKINEIYEKIKDDADFADMAREYSEDGSSKKGGSLGFIARGKTVPEFEKVAFSADVGEISEPFKSQFGWHILKVTDKKQEKQQSYTEVEDKIQKILKDKQAKKVLNKKLEELRKKYDVQINI